MNSTKSPKTIPLLVTVVAGGLLVAVGFWNMITPRMFRSFQGPIRYVHVPDDDEFEGRRAFVAASFWTASEQAEIRAAEVLYGEANAPKFTAVSMTHVPGGSTYVAEMPGRERGQRWFYYFEAQDSEGNLLRVPETAPEKPLPYVTFEGRPGKTWIVAHIVFVMGSLFFLIHALYYALQILLSGAQVHEKYPRKLARSCFWGWVTFFVGAIPLGFYVAYEAFGTAWGGFPVGNDITDNKSLAELVYWGVLLLLRWDLILGRPREGARPGPRALAWATILGILLTLAIYMVPHSYFVQ